MSKLWDFWSWLGGFWGLTSEFGRFLEGVGCRWLNWLVLLKGKDKGKGKSKGNDSVASAAPSPRRYTPTSKNARRGPRLRQSSGRLAMRPRREAEASLYLAAKATATATADPREQATASATADSSAALAE